jgi:phospholipase/lecithinase/hemolysin
MRKQLLAGLVGFLTLSLGVSSTASAYSNVYVFGDSLSDSGAFGHLLGGAFCPAPPYAGCRFSNGPTWAENLAASLGVAANTAYAPGGGTNYAIGGERSDELLASATAINGGQIPDFSGDVGGVADPNALYIVWAGGNNFLQDNPPGTFLPGDAAQDIIDSILALSALGATDFLVPNLPIANSWAFTFNAALSAGLETLTGLDIFEFDVLSFFIGVVSNPGAYGFTNVSTPCFTGGTVCANPDEYLLWDTVHPTAAAHVLLADAALQLIPEPGTGLLVAAGLLGLAGWRSARAQ